MISDILALYTFLNDETTEASILSALFSDNGERIKGDEGIEVIKHKLPNSKDKWFFEVKKILNYVFVPYPVNPSVSVDFGTFIGNTNPDSRLFRFVSTPLSRYSTDGEPNVLVDFIVYGYSPDELMAKGKKK